MREEERLALAVGIWLGEMCVLSTADYYHLQPEKPFLLIAGIVLTGLVFRGICAAGPLALAYVVGVGIADALPTVPSDGSDVLLATKEALATLLGGHNPYLHTYATTRPPLSPFPYLPGELLWYGFPSSAHLSVGVFEKGVGMAMLPLLAVFAPVVGTARAVLCTALYVAFKIGRDTAVSGANDVSLAFLLTAAVLLLAWSEMQEEKGNRWSSKVSFFASALLLAWSLVFKALAWPFFPFIIIYLFDKDPHAAKKYLFTTLGVCVLAVAPFWISAPLGFPSNVYQGFVFHNGGIWGVNLWSALRTMGLPLDAHRGLVRGFDNLLVVAVCVDLLLEQSASLREAITRGLVVLLTALLLSQYTPSTYWSFAITLSVVALMLYNSPNRDGQRKDLPRFTRRNFL